ncbi:putative bifunctional diguanylate cyclase/phosphodiesterase [Mycolicibacterium chubuense]|nr:EAL domain-containing protein [Mycolicibacterium chubuense]
MLNACAFWGDGVARWIAVALQLGACAGAAAYGLTQARRHVGAARWWRVFAAAAMVSFIVGAVAWRLGDFVAPAWWVVPYFLMPLLACASALLLALTSGGMRGSDDEPLRLVVITTTLDGLVAATSFALLVIIGGFGAMSLASLPRSGNAAVDATYALVEMVVVVITAVIGMVYPSHKPNRTNYLIFASGVVLIAGSDRVMAYLDSVCAEGGLLWSRMGFVLGPLFVGLSMRDIPAKARPATRYRPLDWAQLSLPYAGFLGITILLSFHVLRGNRLSAMVVALTLVMVLLVAARQAVALGAQRQLTRRLYDAQHRLAYQVLHDSLTGLPNRLLFGQRLDEAMRDGKFVLIFVDLDDFKEVNDRYGHAAGDDLLRAVGERLKRCVTEADTLARIGGDEFAILIEDEAVAATEDPEFVADRLRLALRDPFPVHGSSVRVRASMGLVRSGDGRLSQTADDLLRQADSSMYAGKRLGKNTAVIYQPASGVRADFPRALREADGGVPAGFSLAYQPVVRLPDETLVALEALARWVAPNGMQIPPETFVAVAEAAGLGAVLDALVLDLACREVKAAGLDVDIHVNIGAARLGNLEFEEQVRRTLERHRIRPSRLVVEITETLPIVDLADAAAQIDRLQAIGVRVALDDYGAGYNSLTYLHALPVHIVKLDRSLAVGADPHRDLTVYRSVIGLCTELGMAVVAEGIETTAQAETILAAGCRLAQGHLFGRPAPITELAWESGRVGVRPSRRHGQFARDPG